MRQGGTRTPRVKKLDISSSLSDVALNVHGVSGRLWDRQASHTHQKVSERDIYDNVNVHLPKVEAEDPGNAADTDQKTPAPVYIGDCSRP